MISVLQKKCQEHVARINSKAQQLETLTYGTKDVAGTGERRNRYLDAYLDSGSNDNRAVLLYFDTSVFRHTNNCYLITMLNLGIFLQRSACKQIDKIVRKFVYVTGGSVNNLQKRYQHMYLGHV